MSCRDEVRRMIIKTSLTSGEKPTVPPNEDHRSGLWSSTDIYKGELFFNVVDGRMYTRGDDGIIEVSSDVVSGDIIYKARISQSGTDVIKLDEYINKSSFAVTSSRSSIGNYDIAGFTGELFNTASQKYEMYVTSNLDAGVSVHIDCTTNEGFKILSYDKTNTPSDNILDDGSGERYHVLTIKKY